jgi:anthranilate synthase component 1
MQYPDGIILERTLDGQNGLQHLLNDFIKSFEVSGENAGENGFFGYTSYDTVKYLENIDIAAHQESVTIPEIKYILYRFVIAINHLRNEMSIIENLTAGQQSRMDELISTIDSRNFPIYDFSSQGEVSSSASDEEYKEMVDKGIKHCMRGDVFQIVISRRFEQRFAGDDFKVYRALRSINPSPYLFYFDFGSYRIFGSSPETHIKVAGNIATIDPIAGTIHRTGNDEKDTKLAETLLEDPKENAEHVMLVDLARNDLSRNSKNVYVKSYKEIQFYSHVIHMVSRVCGEISPDINRISLFTDTFPAGTLSGAPKVRAMQLINQIEKHPRGIYGGCIGHIGFDGNLNQAITIRTFVSYNNTLYYQAGAGIVSKSKPENELAEVNSKLGALNKAIEIANQKQW